MAVEIMNELRAAAIIDGRDDIPTDGVIQIFGMTFERTGEGVYTFTMDSDVDPTQLSIYCSPGINELALPRGRFLTARTLEVRSYTPDGVPADCRVLFVEVHRYPGVLGRVIPPAPPIPTPTPPGGSELVWNGSVISVGGFENFQGVSGILYPWAASVAGCEMTFPPAPANNALIGVKNITDNDVNSCGFLNPNHAVEDPDTGATTDAGFYNAAANDGGFGGSLALVIWRFSTLTDRWHIMHAAKRASASVEPPP